MTVFSGSRVFFTLVHLKLAAYRQRMGCQETALDLGNSGRSISFKALQPGMRYQNNGLTTKKSGNTLRCIVWLRPKNSQPLLQNTSVDFTTNKPAPFCGARCRLSPETFANSSRCRLTLRSSSAIPQLRTNVAKTLVTTLLRLAYQTPCPLRSSLLFR